MTRVFLCKRTVVDTDHRGGWTQIFGGKGSKPETSRPVGKRNLAPQLGLVPSEFCRDLLRHKAKVPRLSYGILA